jgi:PPOX class probable F420-dependent enzyme
MARTSHDEDISHLIGTPQQDAFIRKNRWAVVTTLRKDGSPSNSVVYYAHDGDEVIFSVTTSRLKAKTLLRDPRIAITCLDDGKPYGYVTVEGTVTIVSDDIVPGHVAINRVIRGRSFEPPEGFEARLRKEGRVLVRVHADRVSSVIHQA